MIKAKDGCAICFPKRFDQKRRDAVIEGPKMTRLGWRERWVQVRIDLVSIEIRLEGDNALDLGSNLRCEVVGKLQAQIDDSDLDISLPKVVRRFRCSTTTDPEIVLTESFFRERLLREFLSVLNEVMKKASYRELLNNVAHTDDLKKLFGTKVKEMLGECGFKSISHDIFPEPVNPGARGAYPDIFKIWNDWEIAGHRLEDSKEREEEKRKEQRRRDAILEKFATESFERERSRIDAEDAKAHADILRQNEIERAEKEKDKERRLAEVRKELDDLYHKRQQETIDQANDLKVKEALNKEKEKDIAEVEERARELARLAHQEQVYERRKKAVEQENFLSASELAIARVQAEKILILGKAEAEREQVLMKAKHCVELEILRQQAEMTKAMFERIPEIMKHMPIQHIGETTVISVGKGTDDDDEKGSGGILGMMAFPIIKKLMSLIPEGLRAPRPSVLHKTSQENQSASDVANSVGK